MTKYSLLLKTTIFLSSLVGFASVAEARDGCPVGQHPNPKNPSQCVDNGTTGLGTPCDPGQKKWYNPRTKRWYRCY